MTPDERTIPTTHAPMVAIIERLLTKCEAAKLLGVSERTIDNWRAEGRLRAVKLGQGAVRFDPVDLRAFIDQSKTIGGEQ